MLVGTMPHVQSSLLPRQALVHQTSSFPHSSRNFKRQLHCCALFGNLFQSPTAPIEEDAEGKLLRDWLQASSQPNNPQQLAVASQIKQQGRGLVATSSIRKGDIILQVPEHLIITPDQAQAQSALCRLLPEGPSVPTWSVLALWLIEALAKGSSHSYASYTACLPKATSCMLEWTEEQVEWLKGSHLYRIAADNRTAFKASVEELKPWLDEAQSQGVLPADSVTPALLCRVFSLLLSRLVRLHGLGNTTSTTGIEALVPWADLVNHSCDAATYLEWDQKVQAVVLRADRMYATGQQVFASYGQKTSGELLLSFGFAPPEGTNPHDACLLHIELELLPRENQKQQQDQTKGFNFKAAALEKRGLPHQQTFPLRMYAVPAGLLRFAAFVDAKVDSAEQAEELCAVLLGSGSFAIENQPEDGSLPPKLLQLGLEATVKRCQRALKGYTAGLDSMKSELNKLELGTDTGEGSSSHKKLRINVLRLLIGEQRILNRTVFLLQSQLRELRKGNK